MGIRRKSILCLLFMSWVLPGSVLAQMSQSELRLTALEEKLEAREKKFKWLENFKPKADLRLRHESLFREGDNTASASRKFDRHRERIRFRIGGKYHFTKNIHVGFRLVTGGTDPVSTNQTLDNSFSTKGFQFDRGYAAGKFGFGAIDLKLTGGKFANPFLWSEMLWDSDLSFEGASEQVSTQFGDTKLSLILGQFVIEENGGTNDDPNLMAYQGVIEQKFGMGKAKIGIGYFDYNALAGNVSTQVTKGNTLDAAGNFVTNYDIFNIIGEVGLKTAIPVKIFAEYATNTAGRADDLENDAWQIGAKVGHKIKKFGDWQFKYLYRETERDAVLDAFNDSDFHEGGTNSKGSELGLKVGLYKGILANVSYFITEEITGGKDDLDRLQVDLVFKLF